SHLILGPFGDPPGGIGAELVFFLEPFAPLLLCGRAQGYDHLNPLFQSLASFLGQLGDPFLHHGDAGVNAVKGPGWGTSSARHGNSPHGRFPAGNGNARTWWMIEEVEPEPILPGASPLSTRFCSVRMLFWHWTGDRPAEPGESAEASRITENDGKRE